MGEANLYGLTELINKGFLIQQYTGLKDAKGIEICEGDILQIEELDQDSAMGKYFRYTASIGFGASEYPCSFILLNKRFYKGAALLCHCRNSDAEMTIIGNIFQNPELLK